MDAIVSGRIRTDYEKIPSDHVGRPAERLAIHPYSFVGVNQIW